LCPATTIYLTDERRKALLSRARKRRTSLSEEVREALDLYLDFPPGFEEQSLAALAKEANKSLNRSIASLDDAIAHCRAAIASLSS
jgi:hypothetical protein